MQFTEEEKKKLCFYTKLTKSDIDELMRKYGYLLKEENSVLSDDALHMKNRLILAIEQYQHNRAAEFFLSGGKINPDEYAGFLQPIDATQDEKKARKAQQALLEAMKKYFFSRYYDLQIMPTEEIIIDFTNNTKESRRRIVEYYLHAINPYTWDMRKEHIEYDDYKEGKYLKDEYEFRAFLCWNAMKERFCY